jgi:hypothetical protein
MIRGNFTIYVYIPKLSFSPSHSSPRDQILEDLSSHLGCWRVRILGLCFLGLGFWGLGFGVWVLGFGFRVWVSGFGFQGLGFRV